MKDYTFLTAQKTTREPRILSFYQQTSLKPTQQAITHNYSFTRRKTPSKRYMNINQSDINKTIDFSTFKTHYETLSTVKQNHFKPLPQIQIAKNKKVAKKGSYLQIWLNEALDEGQGNHNFMVSLNDQTLSSLKKYGIDRKLLKAKNISQQTIDKIYKKLYVYSKGLGMTFQQIGQLASRKLPLEQSSVQGSGKQIIQVFWRAFSKIMQNQTPFESAFQMMQKNYLKTIQQLRLRMHGVGQQIQNMQTQHNQQKRKLQRELQTLTVKYRQLQNQYKVNKSTLDLTDRSLDDQIQLRLKFQEKINSVYTSYNELKSKYADLVQELGMKKQLNSLQQKSQCQLKQLLQKKQTKCRQMQYLLSLQQAKVRDLQTELLIKKQEKIDLQREILTNQQQRKKSQDQMTQLIQKQKQLSSLLQQSQNEMSRMKQILQEEKQVNKKLQKRVQDLTVTNNRLYGDKYKVYEQAQMIKQKNKQLTKQTQIKQNDIKKLRYQIIQLNQQIQSLNNQLSHTKERKNDLTYQIQIKTILLQKANQNLSKLKQIKDRHQRLHLLAEHQRNQAIDHNITLMTKLQQLQLQVQNLRNQLLQKQQNAVIELTRFNKNKQFLTKKVIALQQQLNKKQQSLLTHLNTIQTQRIHTLKKQREINQIKQKMQTRQHLIYKLQSQSVLLATNQPLIEQLLKKKQIQINKQTQRNLQNMVTENTLKNKIQQIQMLLNTKSNQIQLQTECYKKLAHSYKEMYEKRRQHPHPMVYQDLLANLHRMNLKIIEMHNHTDVLSRQNESIKLQNNKIKEQNNRQKDQIIKSNQQIKQFKQNIVNLQQQNHNLLQSLKEEIHKSLILLENQNKLKDEMTKLTNQKLTINKQLQVQLIENKLINNKLQQSNEKLKQIQSIHSKLNNKYSQKNQQLLKTQQKCIELQKKLNKLITENSNIATQTDPIKTQTLSIPHQHIRKSRQFLGSRQQLLKVNPTQFQNLESKQITKTLLQQSFQPTTQLKMKQQNQQLKNFMKQTQKQIQIQIEKQKAPLADKKKVEKGQFKRALKLTFMRR